jgi:hypothetical protein
MDRDRVARIARRWLRRAEKWETLPKGWTDESRKKFWSTLTGDVKHKVTKCIKEMEGKGGIDDPGAFCAALADRVEGKSWRSEPRTAGLNVVYEGRGGVLDFDGRRYEAEASDLVGTERLPGTVMIQNRMSGETSLFSNPHPVRDQDGNVTGWTYQGTGGQTLVIRND